MRTRTRSHHEDHVADRRGLLFAALRGHERPRVPQLLEDLGARQLAEEAHRPRGAERARPRAALLRRHAHGVARVARRLVVVADQHRLHPAAARQLDDKLRPALLRLDRCADYLGGGHDELVAHALRHLAWEPDRRQRLCLPRAALGEEVAVDLLQVGRLQALLGAPGLGERQVEDRRADAGPRHERPRLDRRRRRAAAAAAAVDVAGGQRPADAVDGARGDEQRDAGDEHRGSGRLALSPIDCALGVAGLSSALGDGWRDVEEPRESCECRCDGHAAPARLLHEALSCWNPLARGVEEGARREGLLLRGARSPWSTTLNSASCTGFFGGRGRGGLGHARHRARPRCVACLEPVPSRSVPTAARSK